MTTSNGDSLFHRQFIVKVIVIIRDFIDEYGVPLSKQVTQQEYSLINSSFSLVLLSVSQRHGKMSS